LWLAIWGVSVQYCNFSPVQCLISGDFSASFKTQPHAAVRPHAAAGMPIPRVTLLWTSRTFGMPMSACGWRVWGISVRYCKFSPVISVPLDFSASFKLTFMDLEDFWYANMVGVFGPSVFGNAIFRRRFQCLFQDVAAGKPIPRVNLLRTFGMPMDARIWRVWGITFLYCNEDSKQVRGARHSRWKANSQQQKINEQTNEGTEKQGVKKTGALAFGEFGTENQGAGTELLMKQQKINEQTNEGTEKQGVKKTEKFGIEGTENQARELNYSWRNRK